MIAVKSRVGRAIKLRSTRRAGGARGVRVPVRYWALIGLISAMGVAASACSTGLSSNSEALRAAAVEREALSAAAEAVRATKWPKPEAADWGARLAGVVGDGRFSEEDAAAAYVAGLRAPRKPALIADANAHLDAAAELARIGEAVAQSVRPAMADVSTLEEAIVDLRTTREVYLAGMKAIAKDGEPVAPGEVRAIKASFSEAIEKLGDTADDLADAVEADRTETFAGPAAPKFVN